MKPKNVIRTLASTFGAVAASALLAMPAWAQQASINLEGSSLSYCNTSQNTWKIEKTADQSTVNSGSSVTWTITATKNPDLEGPPPHVLCAEGTITISNSGSMPATVGNIVVNLQKQVQIAGKWRWVSAAANVANSFAGDGATSAKIVANASAENPSWNASGAGNYSVSGAVGTFTETPGVSGSIEFTDATNNTLFSITPSFNVIQGAPVTLKYKANFNNALLGISGGTVLRTEVIVTFGNAGGRGGSGASTTNVDINGNGSPDPSENNVRSVPVRLTSTLPAYVNCNNEVSLLDAISVTETAAYEVSSNTLPASGTTDSSGSWTITATLTGNGTVTNTIDLFSKEPYASDPCCDVVDESAESTVTVIEECPDCVPPPPSCRTDPTLCPRTGEFCTFTIGGWGQRFGGNGGPARFRDNNWTTPYPVAGTGPETGIPGSGGFSAQFTGPAAVAAYQDNGTPSPFTADTVNPTSTSAGTFGRQVLGQVLALAFSDAAPTGGYAGGFAFNQGYGSLIVTTTRGTFTISQLIAEANNVLGGGTSDFSLGELHTLMTNLNEGFDECQVKSWALANVTKPN